VRRRQGLGSTGVDAVLVEKGNLTHGTTGRDARALTQRGRYAVSIRRARASASRRTTVLRDIAGHCVEETGGLFVKRPEDSEEYFQEKLEGCRACDIPVEMIDGEEARRREPYLARDVEKAIALPDAAVDPFRLCVANAADAREHGARIETHAPVTDVLVEDGEIVGVEIEHETGPASASTASRGRPRRSARATSSTRPARGRATSARWPASTWKCALEGRDDGDEHPAGRHRHQPLSTEGRRRHHRPHETACILGTTDEEVDDPEDYPEEEWEVDLMIETPRN